jgi:hypothetical protein
MYCIFLQREKEAKKKNKRPRLQYNIAPIGKNILQKGGGL